MAETPSSSVDPVDALSSSIKDSAKWMLATFGAVAAVALAGIALTDFASVVDSDKRDYAIASAVVAFVGVILAIIAASAVLVSGYTTIEDVTLHDDELQLTGFASIADFRSEFKEALQRQRAYVKAWAEAPDQTTREELAVDVKSANSAVATYNTRSGPILARAKYKRIMGTFRWARFAIVGGTAMTIIGAFGFVFYTSPGPEGPVVGDVPVAVEVALTADGVKLIKRELGDTCLAEELSGTAIRTDGSHVIVAFAATDECAEGIVKFTTDDALITRAD